MRTYIISLLALLVLTGVAAADGKQFRYVGIHPIPKAAGGGVCHIEVPHVHVYAPIDVKVQFRDHDGWNYFVGDPVAYGWDGPKTTYYGHHPIPVDVIVGDDQPDTEYCYLEGPHFHAWAPPPALEVELRGGAYWYVGSFPKAYVDARPVYDPIDVVYQPIHYQRPVIAVDVAPPGWYGAVVVAPAVVAPTVVVPARPRIEAGVEIHVPAPTLRVEFGVGVGIGGGVIVGGHGRGRGHDDHGGHRGWGKHGRGHR